MSIQSDWAYVEFDANGQRLVVVIDLDQGGRSVTNDADNIVADLWGRQIITAASQLIYRDSQGQFDQILFRDGYFVDFKGLGGATTLATAARALDYDINSAWPVRGVLEMDEFRKYF